MSVRDRFRRWWGMPFVAVLLVAAACDGSGSSGSSGPGSGGASPRATVTTTGVTLPEGDEPVVVTPWGDDLLVGMRAREGSASHRRSPCSNRAAAPVPSR